MVTACDHRNPSLLGRELEHEVRGKTLQVPFHHLVQHLDIHLIQQRQVLIQQNPVLAQNKDRALDTFHGFEVVLS